MGENMEATVVHQPDPRNSKTDHVDVLFVTALEDEYNALIALLPNAKVDVFDTVASVQRSGSPESYRVAVIVTGQTTALAEAAVKDAIVRRAPRAVILVGIAAGFPEASVSLGDILIPFWIFPYEHAKITEESTAGNPVPPTDLAEAVHPHLLNQHRGELRDVSHSLWNAAKNLSRDHECPWLARIPVPRPSSEGIAPKIHADLNYILGSGDKLVASKFAEVREWLIHKYRLNAIGLEMEGYGAIIACRSADTPFLLVKAMQDTATGAKDDPGTKDLWRNYAAAAAAAFAMTLVERYRFPSDRTELTAVRIEDFSVDTTSTKNRRKLHSLPDDRVWNDLVNDATALERDKAVLHFIDALEKRMSDPAGDLLMVDLTAAATEFRNWLYHPLYQQILLMDSRYLARYRERHGEKGAGVVRTFIIDPSKLSETMITNAERTLLRHVQFGLQASIIYRGSNVPDDVIGDLANFMDELTLDFGDHEHLFRKDMTVREVVAQKGDPGFAAIRDRVAWTLDVRNIDKIVRAVGDVDEVVRDLRAKLKGNLQTNANIKRS
jgi:nucleoside phosphorylase